jgi:hypothetical protein
MKNKLFTVILTVLVLTGIGACKKEKQAAEAQSPEKATEAAIEEKKVEEKQPKNPLEGTYWMATNHSPLGNVFYSGLTLGKNGNGKYYDTGTKDNHEVKYGLEDDVWYIGRSGKEENEFVYELTGIDVTKTPIKELIKMEIYQKLNFDGENLTYVYKLKKTNEQEFKNTFAQFIK